MRRLTRLIAASLTACAVLSTPSAVRGQEEMMESPPAQKRPATRPAGSSEGPLIQRARDIVGELNLTDSQQTKIDRILADAAESGRDMMSSDQPRRRRAEQMRDRFTDLREQIAAVLDDEQKVAFREKLESFRRELAGGPPGAGLPPAQQLQRLQESLGKLELKKPQQEKIDAILTELRGQLTELREGLRAGDEMAREKLGVAMQEARTQMGEVLNPDQLRRLRRLMDSRDGGEMGAGMMMDEQPMRDGRRGRGGGQRDDGPAAPTLAPDQLRPGTRAPDFTLKRLGGTMMALSSLEGRPVVIVFGSYSSPSFRQRAAALEQLKKELGQRVQLLVIYTKEAHPKGGWEVERNRDSEIELEQHKDLEDREAMAEKARSALKLTVPILLDTMDDATAKAYGLAPNGAVVIGRGGKVIARQQWFDPYTLRRHIDAAAKPATQPAAATN